MGSVIFWILHIGAVLFGLWALIITIPLHIIYLAVRKKPQPEAQAAAATPATSAPSGDLKRCPACAELIQRAALKCKHCGEMVLAREVAQSLAASSNLDGLQEVEIVGESHYQADIAAIDDAWLAGGNTHPLAARLVQEPDNPHDKHAVRVEIAHRTVGYLPRQLAAEWRAALKTHYQAHGRDAVVTAPAEIRGSDRRGVVVYLPDRLVELLGA